MRMRAVAERRRQIAEDPHLLAREIAQRNRGGDEEIPALLLLAHVGAQPMRVVAVHRRQHRADLRHDAGPGHLRAGRARDGLENRRRLDAPPGGRLFDRRPLRVERQRAPPSARNSASALLVFGEEPIPAERLDQELQPVRLLVLVVAELVEHADDRFGDVEHLRRRQEVVHRRGRLHHDRRAAADRRRGSRALPSRICAR